MQVMKTYNSSISVYLKVKNMIIEKRVIYLYLILILIKVIIRLRANDKLFLSY